MRVQHPHASFWTVVEQRGAGASVPIINPATAPFLHRQVGRTEDFNKTPNQRNSTEDFFVKAFLSIISYIFNSWPLIQSFCCFGTWFSALKSAHFVIFLIWSDSYLILRNVSWDKKWVSTLLNRLYFPISSSHAAEHMAPFMGSSGLWVKNILGMFGLGPKIYCICAHDLWAAKEKPFIYSWGSPTWY